MNKSKIITALISLALLLGTAGISSYTTTPNRAIRSLKVGDVVKPRYHYVGIDASGVPVGDETYTPEKKETDNL